MIVELIDYLPPITANTKLFTNLIHITMKEDNISKIVKLSYRIMMWTVLLCSLLISGFSAYKASITINGTASVYIVYAVAFLFVAALTGLVLNCYKDI